MIYLSCALLMNILVCFYLSRLYNWMWHGKTTGYVHLQITILIYTIPAVYASSSTLFFILFPALQRSRTSLAALVEEDPGERVLAWGSPGPVSGWLLTTYSDWPPPLSCLTGAFQLSLVKADVPTVSPQEVTLVALVSSLLMVFTLAFLGLFFLYCKQFFNRNCQRGKGSCFTYYMNQEQGSN